MAISLKTAGSWARMVTDNGTVAIPGSPAAGDRMFLFGAWKDFAITVVTPNGWNLIDDFSDGSTGAGNGTGSVHNAVWYRDWQSGDAAPAIDYSAAPTEGHWVIMLWQKGAGDVWATPVAVHAAIAANDPWSATSSATLTVLDGSVVMELAALRDDSTTIARDASTALEDDGSPNVTWNGNYVESPATHFNSTTGLDMSGDLGHRFVTTGAAGVNLTSTGDPVAAETGTVTWVMQGLAPAVTGTGGITVAAPGAASTAAETMEGTAALALAAPAVSASGAETMTGTGAISFLAPAVAGTGEQAAGEPTGTAAITFAAPAVSATALETLTGSATLTFAAPALAASAAEAFLGTSALSFLAPTLDGTGLVIVPVTGTAGLAIAPPSLSASGIGGVEAHPSQEPIVHGPPIGAAIVIGAAGPRPTPPARIAPRRTARRVVEVDDPEDLWLLGLTERP